MSINDNDIVTELNDMMQNTRDLPSHFRGDQIDQGDMDDILDKIRDMKDKLVNV